MAEHRRGANLPAIGGFNRTVVLDAIRRSDEGLSRVELAERTGLSAQTVSNVTRRLLDVGMIVESGTIIQGPGKPRTMLRLDPASRYAVGVHVDPAIVTYLLLDMAGGVVARHTTATPTADDPEHVIRTIARAVDELVAGAGIGADSVLGVGIASPGPIDAVAGVVLDPPFLPRWRDVALRDELADATGYRVILEKDVIAAAVGETFLAGDAGARNFAFVYYGTGFGVGLVLDHEPVRGAASNAGDAGHIIVEQGAIASELGGRGEVGGTVAPDRLVALAADRGLDLGAATSPGDVDRAWDRLAARLHDGEPTASAIAAAAGAAMGRAVVVIVNLLDLDRVVFGGPFWNRIAPVALPAAASAVSGSGVLVPKHPVVVTESAHGSDVAAIGAACLVLDAALSPKASSLVIGR